MPKKSTVGTYKVRCLGPREAEHFFLSRDPSSERICRLCREKQQAVGVAIRDTPVRTTIKWEAS